MSDHNSEELEPVQVDELLKEFSDHTIAELVLEIKEGKEALEQEKKAHAVDEFIRNKLQVECDELNERIHKAELALSGKVVEEED